MDPLSERIAALSPEKRALLERHLESRKRLSAPGQIAPPKRLESSPIPLSFAQQRLWFLEQLEPGLPFYNLPLATRISGTLIVSRLCDSLNEIVRRHEVLRTTFPALEGQPIQVIAPATRLEIPVLDLSTMPEADREMEVVRQASIEANRPFDLTRDTPIRCSLLRLREAEHVLLVTMHHIASDGWSMNIFWNELSTLYGAFCSGRPSPLPHLPVQYADFAIWQRSWLSGVESDRLLGYWKTKLANAPPLLQMPTDRSRPRVQAFEGAAYTVPLPNQVAEDLKAVCRQAGATLYMVLLAAFKVLLHRYSGETDLNVGSPVANRSRVEWEKLIGFFVNTLVIRTDVSDDPTFEELIARVKETSLEAFAHQDLPFEKLVEELQPRRSLSYNPIFQVMFVLQNFQSASQMGRQATAPQFNVGTSKFDLTFSAAEMADGLTIGFEYNTRLFERQTIIAMSHVSRAILENIVRTKAVRISEIPLLSPEDQRRIVLESAGPSGLPAQASLIHHLCEIPARQTPEATALWFGSVRLSYRELNERANQLARALRDQGVGQEAYIGVFLDRSPEMLVAFLAVLKAGGVYVPLDPTYPASRLEYMLADSAISLLLTREKLLPQLAGFPGGVLCLDSNWELVSKYPAHNLEIAISPDNLAYVIYTSGSTGRPKGSMVEHRGVCNLAEAQIHAFGLSSSDRVLQFASPGFDASLFEILMTLRAGAALCLAEREEILPGSPLIQYLRLQRITTLVIPPSALVVLPTVALPDLRVIVAVGEACPLDVVTRWKTGKHFFNAYGPTEVSICSTIAKCTDDSISPPIGRAIPNTRAYLLDVYLNPVPSGASGEIYLAGTGVSRGYHRNPGLTADRYLPDPFSDAPGARCYRTGDRARLLQNGELQYLGRVDQQVKIRGYRIELGEVEAALSRHPVIGQAAVVGQTSPSGETRIVAFYVEESGIQVSISELRSFLRQTLPDFMIPSAFVSLPALPMNAHAKLDRKALPVVSDTIQLSPEGALTGPRNQTEEALVRIWRELLQVEPGIHDNFFELGGHSLLATRAISRINTAFGIDLPLRDIFEFPTIAQLAPLIDETPENELPTEERSIPRLPRQAIGFSSSSS